MQIKIEIDVKPEELRRFLGLPDVAGLQDDVLQFLREKVGQVNENFNPTDFVKGNLELLKQSPALKRLLARVNLAADAPAEETAKPAPRKRSARRSPRTKSEGK
ncbi:hypothetical protein DFR24_4494 [Panacagrimonas perspica]|uniref:Uncharacterized protein n=1 Tax=Panacagrimonas perspica TaxID=381431 RepID=A0A4S3K942_9GAMM|nr:hypothetical protein [Panacagrimonas perspica]TDU24229.1 hypothetical protein DFR24_4494 [Panacagrimonas perspica]THD04638.1 hypothetical protein B1810_04265 [Panacagrimonas perspica]